MLTLLVSKVGLIVSSRGGAVIAAMTWIDRKRNIMENMIVQSRSSSYE